MKFSTSYSSLSTIVSSASAASASTSGAPTNNRYLTHVARRLLKSSTGWLLNSKLFVVYACCLLLVCNLTLVVFYINARSPDNHKYLVHIISGRYRDIKSNSNNHNHFNRKGSKGYDLMRDVLERQNMTRFRIACEADDDEDDESEMLENANNISADADYVTERVDIFKKYYSNAKPHRLEFNWNTTSGRRHIHSIRVCTIEWKEKLIARKFGASYVKYLKSRVDEIERTKLNELMNVESLEEGGYFRPDICFQDMFFFMCSRKYNNSIHGRRASESACSTSDSQLLTRVIREPNDTSLSIIFQSMIGDKANGERLLDEFLNSKDSMTAIVIPFLRRDENLIELLLNLHSFLQRQFIHYRIFVAEQANSNDPFNKGRLYNKAFKYIKDNYPNVNCFIMHDVDLIPESDYNLYECDHQANIPRHLSFSIRHDSDGTAMSAYKNSAYELLVGGVLCVKPPIYERINGFSNEYWSWGAEDDGLFPHLFFINFCV